MNDTMVTLVGNAATAVEHRQTAAGVTVARFRLAARSRRWDKALERWTDGETSFYTVRSWRGLADNVAASVAVGEPLIVQGRLRLREGSSRPRRAGSAGSRRRSTPWRSATISRGAPPHSEGSSARRARQRTAHRPRLSNPPRHRNRPRLLTRLHHRSRIDRNRHHPRPRLLPHPRNDRNHRAPLHRHNRVYGKASCWKRAAVGRPTGCPRQPTRQRAGSRGRPSTGGRCPGPGQAPERGQFPRSGRPPRPPP